MWQHAFPVFDITLARTQLQKLKPSKPHSRHIYPCECMTSYGCSMLCTIICTALTNNWVFDSFQDCKDNRPGTNFVSSQDITGICAEVMRNFKVHCSREFGDYFCEDDQ